MMQTNASFSSIIILVKDDLSNIQEMSAPYDEKTQTKGLFKKSDFLTAPQIRRTGFRRTCARISVFAAFQLDFC
jgi:hypothetical protein